LPLTQTEQLFFFIWPSFQSRELLTETNDRCNEYLYSPIAYSYFPLSPLIPSGILRRWRITDKDIFHHQKRMPFHMPNIYKIFWPWNFLMKYMVDIVNFCTLCLCVVLLTEILYKAATISLFSLQNIIAEQDTQLLVSYSHIHFIILQMASFNSWVLYYFYFLIKDRFPLHVFFIKKDNLGGHLRKSFWYLSNLIFVLIFYLCRLPDKPSDEALK
jgi:hypothetical protein